MEDDKQKIEEKAFISYYDEKNEIVEGYFTIIECNGFLLKFRTSRTNIVAIPLSRVLKIKYKEAIE